MRQAAQRILTFERSLKASTESFTKSEQSNPQSFTLPPKTETITSVLDPKAVDMEAICSFVKIAVTHHSPYVAKEITTNLINDINDRMRRLDIAEAEKSIGYLTDALEKTAIADMQQIFYQLIEKQQQTKMLANVRDEYVFKVIDPAVVPEKKSGPKRALICLLLVTSAFLISCLVLIVRDQVKKSRD